MRVDVPPPGEELNLGEVVEARQAASLILMRDSPSGPEVLLVKRNPAQRFLGGAWVFPGGTVHAGDTDHAATAIRELAEEAGITLPRDAELVLFSRWITPAQLKVRFDTRFFAAEAPAGARAASDGNECVDVQWLRPRDALAACERDELMLVFPTIKQLEQLAEFHSVADVLETARRRTVEPVQPRIVLREGAADLLLPGEPGYDEA